MSATSISSVSSIASVQPVSATPPDSTTQAQKHLRERRVEMQQLNQALQARDLNAAQQAYNKLAALSNLNAIGRALQSGNLDGAQQSFAALQSTYQQELPPGVAASGPPVTAVHPSNTSSAASATLDVSNPVSTTATSLADQVNPNLAKAAPGQEVVPNPGAGNGSSNSGGVNVIA